MQIKRSIAVAALAVGFATAGFSAGAAAAAPDECTVDNFTANGVFDQEGYLACLAAGAGAPGAPSRPGVLPATGQDPLQAVGLAAGLLLVGGSLAVSSRRRKSSAA
jgi:LPXTG-motif cell wall-anchored protein